MTLKQFFEVAGGVLIALLFYSSGLHFLIRWPAIIFFVLLGVGLAFFPFRERPLEQWIIAFFRSIYSPTIYHWVRTDKPVSFFKEDATTAQDSFSAPRGEVVMQEYLKSLPGRGRSTFSKLEAAEKSFLSKVGTLFGAPPTSVPAQAQTQSQRPLTSQKLEVPRVQSTPIPAKQSVPSFVVEEKPAVNMTAAGTPTAPVSPAFSQKPSQTTATQAQFSAQAALPLPPEYPNTVTGQVMDGSGKIVEGAILEIKDIANRPVRAIKTNKAGHFITVTPLQNGKYEIDTEKAGLVFDPLTFEASGGIIPPIAIRSKGKVVTEEIGKN